VAFPFVTVVSFVFEKWHPVKNGRAINKKSVGRVRRVPVLACIETNCQIKTIYNLKTWWSRYVPRDSTSPPTDGGSAQRGQDYSTTDAYFTQHAIGDLMPYLASDSRYDTMTYNRAGKSGLKLPAISLGWWYNFGGVDRFENMRAIARRAFDLGVTHFDLANNYGPPPGSAEMNFGLLYKQDFRPYRDELIISTKAGYDMWPGPYGEWGSRKYLLASLDQSLKRMGLDYVDIFYSHRPDPDTPLEETMGALDSAVRQGKALYVGISSYSPEMTREAARILRQMGTPCLIHQPSYNMFDRWIEDGLLDVLSEERIGCIVFSPLAQGQLTQRYLNGIPSDARASKTERVWLTPDDVKENLPKVKQLNELAQARGQSLAQMAIAWTLRNPVVTSALIGASSVNQLEDNLAALNNLNFSEEELDRIEEILK
jgi:L-glyceraldehyde 3-phosphate reductase